MNSLHMQTPQQAVAAIHRYLVQIIMAQWEYHRSNLFQPHRWLQLFQAHHRLFLSQSHLPRQEAIFFGHTPHLTLGDRRQIFNSL